MPPFKNYVDVNYVGEDFANAMDTIAGPALVTAYAVDPAPAIPVGIPIAFATIPPKLIQVDASKHPLEVAAQTQALLGLTAFFSSLAVDYTTLICTPMIIGSANVLATAPIAPPGIGIPPPPASASAMTAFIPTKPQGVDPLYAQGFLQWAVDLIPPGSTILRFMGVPLTVTP